MEINFGDCMYRLRVFSPGVSVIGTIGISGDQLENKTLLIWSPRYGQSELLKYRGFTETMDVLQYN
jgi:hypothetical protein